MGLSNDEIDQAERQILLELQRNPGLRRPREVINKIRDEHGLSDSALRAAIWYLIDRNLIALTPDLRVQRVAPPPGQRVLSS
jgi:hypothetical protein